MRVISFGDIELDYYFKNELLYGISLSGVSFNILANLSTNYETIYFYNGNNEVNILNNTKINMVKMGDNSLKKIYKLSDGYTSICPVCNRNTKYKSIIINPNIVNSINPDDFIVVDNINEDTMNILNKLDNNKFLLLNYISNIDELSLDELLELLSNKFKIVCLSSKIYNYIRSKFKIDDTDLYDELNCDLLMVFYGKKGSTLIYNNTVMEKEIETFNSVDECGSIETFFASFIKLYLDNKELDDKEVSSCYIEAITKYMLCSQFLGNISHIYPLRKISTYNECICQSFSL